MANSKNFNIAFLRILAILMVVFSHMLRHFEGIAVLAKLFSPAPLLFLVISGYLYGGRSIENTSHFLVGRFKKVFLPSSLFSLFASIALIIAGEAFSFRKLLGSILNLYGFTFIFFSEKSCGIFQYYEDLSYLWYVTSILLCYILLLFLNKFKKSHCIKNYEAILIISALIAADMVLMVRFQATIKHFIYFIIGYWIGSKDIMRRQTRKSYIFSACFIVAFAAIRLLMRRGLYGSVFYKVFSELATGSITMLLFISGFAIDMFINGFTSSVSLSRFGMLIDDNSYYIYICHGLFCLSGRFDIFYYFESKVISIFLCLALTALCVISLKHLLKLLRI